MICKRSTNEEGKQIGYISLQGTAKLATVFLSFNLALISDVKWAGKDDPSNAKWQELILRIPPTHLHLATVDGYIYRLTFFNNLARWEALDTIFQTMENIKSEKRRQEVTVQGITQRPPTEG